MNAFYNACERIKKRKKKHLQVRFAKRTKTSSQCRLLCSSQRSRQWRHKSFAPSQAFCPVSIVATQGHFASHCSRDTSSSDNVSWIHSFHFNTTLWMISSIFSLLAESVRHHQDGWEIRTQDTSRVQHFVFVCGWECMCHLFDPVGASEGKVMN